MLGSIVVLALFLSELTSVVMEARDRHHVRNRFVEVACEYMSRQGTTKSLATVVRNHLQTEARSGHINFKLEEEVINSLPASLKRALHLDTQSPLLSAALPFATIKRVHP